MKKTTHFQNLHSESYRIQAAPASEPNLRTRKSTLKILAARFLFGPLDSVNAPRKRVRRTVYYKSGRKRASSGPWQGLEFCIKAAAASTTRQNYSFSKFPHHAMFAPRTQLWACPGLSMNRLPHVKTKRIIFKIYILHHMESNPPQPRNQISERENRH